jgi:hypothetical protein
MSLIKSFFSRVRGGDAGVPAPGGAQELRNILSTQEFNAELARERDRSDRCGRPFCLLSFEARPGSASAAWLAGFLQRRLRSIDRPGWLQGKLCVLLPETTSQGAWKLTDEIRRQSPGSAPVACEVFRYPSEESGGNLSAVFPAHSKSLSVSKSD